MRALLPIACSMMVGACQGAPAVSVRDATLSAGPNSAAVYATIVNEGGADRLTGIEIEGRVPISLHVTSNDGGVMRMRAVDGLDVPAGGTLELKSGGAHGMAMGRIAAAGGQVPLTFRFEKSPALAVTASLTGPGGMEHRR